MAIVKLLFISKEAHLHVHPVTGHSGRSLKVVKNELNCTENVPQERTEACHIGIQNVQVDKL